MARQHPLHPDAVPGSGYRVAAAALGLSWLLAFAAASPANAEAVTESSLNPLEEVVVTGRRPGPPLWRVVHGENTLWVFGTVSPLPRTLEWDDASLDHLMTEAGALLLPPALSMSTSNPFRAVGLLRRFNRLQKLPKGERLEDQLAPQILEQYQAVVAAYGLRAARYQRLKPLFAGDELFDDALKAIGLEADDRLQQAIVKRAKRHDVPVLDANVGVEIDEGLGYFEALDPAASLSCFEAVLKSLDSDVSAARERAMAWADGDASTLMDSPQGAVREKCHTSPVDASGAADVRQQSRELWLSEAERLLASNRVAIAVLPVDEIFGAEGLIHLLGNRGYQIRGQGFQ